MMAHIPVTVRREVIRRARGRCEYCQAARIVIGGMEIDHIIPLSAGGQTTLENLCLACPQCNSTKLDHQTGIDPDTGESVPLFNPRSQLWHEHFAWSGDGTRIVGLTSTGRATIARLRMNRETILESRRLWVAAGWHPPQPENEAET